MSSIAQAETLLDSWLHREHEYQFGKNQVTHHADPESSLAYIMGTELDNKWNRFQLFNKVALETSDRIISLQASQQILKACGAARGALVWSYVTSGCAIDMASDETWNDLSGYYTAWEAGEVTLPDSELLDASLVEAIKPASTDPIEGIYNVKPVFIRLAGLAIVHLLDQETRLGDMLIPKPGTASGNIEPWSF